MINGYARATKLVIPAARSVIAKELKAKYNLTEQEIAAKLDIAQAAVSKYLSGKYSSKIKEIEARINREKIAGKVSMLVSGDKKYANSAICTICKMENEFDCGFSKA
ncbi:MAG: helix-turn-helix domain-containing protein [Candidatus Micrarchaeaceae archaeon]